MDKKIQRTRIPLIRNERKFNKSMCLSVIRVLLLLLSIIPLSGFSQKNKMPAEQEGFYINDGFIKGLYNQTLDVTNAKEVLAYMVERLPREVTIYPSENYYYFTFTAQGKLFKGSLSLFVSNRDSGAVDIGYIEVRDNVRDINAQAAQGAFGVYRAKDSVYLKKLDDFKYQLNFRGKKVIFNLFQQGLKPPQKAHLAPDEIFLGNSMDESGLQFFLLFNQSQTNLYWVLNEDGYVPESFTNYTDEILIGNRSSFAFYDDTLNTRKILIGVEGTNVMSNNWYDGPFDQMPDNYVYTGQLTVKKYLELSYKGTEGRIDKYGHYTDERGMRIAVAPYLVYFSKSELLETITYCRTSTPNHSEFCRCITRQVFNVPEDFYENGPAFLQKPKK